MQGVQNWILPKYVNANRFFWDSLAGNLVEPLLSLYGTEWRERGYGLSILFSVVFTTSPSSHYGCVLVLPMSSLYS
jgi:hypothetical protein